MSIRLHGIVQSNNCGEGNKLFQLFTAIIYAHKNNLVLLSKPIIKCINIDYEKLNKNKFSKKNLIKVHLSSGDFDSNDELKFYGHDKLYWITDFFQNGNYLNNNYDIINQYVETNSIIEKLVFKFFEPIKENDILCILRMGEMKGKELVDPSYFLRIFEKNNFDKIYFMIYPKKQDDISKYLEKLGKYKDKIVLMNNNNSKLDFYVVNHFKYIAISVSTFNWWSIFFCKNINNKIIYTPKYIGHVGKNKRLRPHCKGLWNIRNKTIPIEHEFFKL